MHLKSVMSTENKYLLILEITKMRRILSGNVFILVDY